MKTVALTLSDGILNGEDVEAALRFFQRHGAEANRRFPVSRHSPNDLPG